MKYTPYLLSILNTLCGIWSLQTAHYNFFAFYLFFIFAIIPLLDSIFPKVPNVIQPQKKSIFLEILLLAFPWMQWLLLVIALQKSADLNAIHFVVVMIAVGLTNGASGVTFAHELLHRSDAFRRLSGQVLLLAVAFLCFSLIHLKLHHGYVGTPKDPSTAQRDESIYHFIVRSIRQGWASAWQLENKKCQRGLLVTALLSGLILFSLGPIALAMYLGQSLIAILLLECINYIQHYGLTRAHGSQGSWEPVSAMHSWDCSGRISNYFLINLQLHADHHLHPSRPFYWLKPSAQSPQLPTGYQAMLMIAMIPPLWKRIMNPRLIRFQNRQ